MFYLLVVLFLSHVACQTQECAYNVLNNTEIASFSDDERIALLDIRKLTIDECVSMCCLNPNCTTVTFYDSVRVNYSYLFTQVYYCYLYNCGYPDVCIRTKSNKTTLYEFSKTATNKEYLSTSASSGFIRTSTIPELSNTTTFHGILKTYTVQELAKSSTFYATTKTPSLNETSTSPESINRKVSLNPKILNLRYRFEIISSITNLVLSKVL